MKKVKTLVVNDFRSSLKSKKEFSEFVYWCTRESKQTKIQVEFNENELDLLSKFCRFMDDCLVYSFTKKYVFENLDIIINISITEDYDENKMYDCWIYNMPFVKKISIIGIFKDPRQLEWFECCNSDDVNYKDLGSISDMIKEKITKSKFYYYRQAIEIPVPNKQIPR